MVYTAIVTLYSCPRCGTEGCSDHRQLTDVVDINDCVIPTSLSKINQ